MIMTSVAAIVMRMTVFTRPGYGATSQRMNSRNQGQETVGALAGGELRGSGRHIKASVCIRG